MDNIVPVEGDLSVEVDKKRIEVKKKKNNKPEDISCWNCFRAELIDNDPEPLTLSEVRKNKRKTMKLYSFFASELSKPTAISLKQKVSANYVIGKKLEEKITKKDHSDEKSDSYPESELKICGAPIYESNESNIPSVISEETNREFIPDQKSIVIEEKTIKSEMFIPSSDASDSIEFSGTDRSNNATITSEGKAFSVGPSSPIYAKKNMDNVSSLDNKTTSNITSNLPIKSERVKRNITNTSPESTTSPSSQPFEDRQNEEILKPSVSTKNVTGSLERQEKLSIPFTGKLLTENVPHKVNLPGQKNILSSRLYESSVTKNSPNQTRVGGLNIIKKPELNNIGQSSDLSDAKVIHTPKVSKDSNIIQMVPVDRKKDREGKTKELFGSKTKSVSLKQILNYSEKGNEGTSHKLRSPEPPLKSNSKGVIIPKRTSSPNKINQSVSSDEVKRDDVEKSVVDYSSPHNLKQTDSDLTKSQNITNMTFRDIKTEDDESDHEIHGLLQTHLHICESDEFENDSQTLAKPLQSPNLSNSVTSKVVDSISNRSDIKDNETLNLTQPNVADLDNLPTNNTDEKIIHKVPIKTSTPKSTREEVNTRYPELAMDIGSTEKVTNLDEIEKIIQGIENISLENKGIVSDKQDYVSNAGSESGYAGSSFRDLYEIDGICKSSKEPTNSGDLKSSQSDNNLMLTHEYKTSLPSIKSSPKGGILSMSTKSLCFSPSRIPVRKVRWSTLSLSRTTKNGTFFKFSNLTGFVNRRFEVLIAHLIGIGVI